MFVDGAPLGVEDTTSPYETAWDTTAATEGSHTLTALAREHGLTPTQMALAFCLSRPFMASVIIGATSIAQLKTDIGAANVALSQDVMNGIRRLHRLFPAPI